MSRSGLSLPPGGALEGPPNERAVSAVPAVDDTRVRQQALEIIESILAETDPRSQQSRSNLQERFTQHPDDPKSVLLEHLIVTRTQPAAGAAPVVHQDSMSLNRETAEAPQTVTIPIDTEVRKRIQSVLRAWQVAGGGDVASLQDVDLSALEGPQAQALMLQLAKYPEMLTAAAEGEAPHDVTFYLRDLAASYHSYYDAERILVDDEVVKKARLALVAATAQVLHNGLAVLGVSAPARM